MKIYTGVNGVHMSTLKMELISVLPFLPEKEITFSHSLPDIIYIFQTYEHLLITVE